MRRCIAAFRRADDYWRTQTPRGFSVKIANGYSVEGVALPAGDRQWRGEYTLRERPPGSSVYTGKAEGLFASEMEAANAARVAGEAHADRLRRPRGFFG